MKRLKALILVGLFLVVPSIAMADGTVLTFLNTTYGLGNWEEISAAYDQIWKNIDGATVTATGLYDMGETQKLGYNLDEVGPFVLGSNVWIGPTPFTPFIAASTGSFTVTPTSNLFIWALSVTQGRQWSLESNNPDGEDFMRTFLIDGLDGNNNPIYVIAWNSLASGDTDFNELIAEINGAKPYSAVPEPATMLLFGLGLLGLAGVRRKLKK